MPNTAVLNAEYRANAEEIPRLIWAECRVENKLVDSSANTAILARAVQGSGG